MELPRCDGCGESKTILTPTSTSIHEKYLCIDCGTYKDSWLNWIERSATDGEIRDSNSCGSTKK